MRHMDSPTFTHTPHNDILQFRLDGRKYKHIAVFPYNIKCSVYTANRVSLKWPENSVKAKDDKSTTLKFIFQMEM